MTFEPVLYSGHLSPPCYHSLVLCRLVLYAIMRLIVFPMARTGEKDPGSRRTENVFPDFS